MRNSRYLCLWVPDWPIIATCMSSEDDPYREPIAIIRGSKITYTNVLARQAGIRQGMSLRHARSLCSSLITHRHQPEQWDALFDSVAHSVGSVIADPCIVRPGIVVASAYRAQRWLGSEEEACALITDAVADDIGVESLAGAGQGILTSIVAAREGNVIPQRQTQSFLCKQALSSILLALPDGRARHDMEQVISLCHSIGLRTLGDIVGLGKRAIVSRFGHGGLILWGYATGEEHLAMRPTAQPDNLTHNEECDPPITHAEHALFVIKKAADALCNQMERGSYTCDRLIITFRTHHNRTLERSWMVGGTPRPTHVTDRARWQIDSWLARLRAAAQAGDREEHGLITHIAITATGLSPARNGRQALWGYNTNTDDDRLYRAAERLRTLPGNYSVSTPYPTGSRRYETRILLQPWDSSSQKSSLVSSSLASSSTSPLSLSPSFTQHGGEAQTGGREELWWGALPSPAPSLLVQSTMPIGVYALNDEDLTISARGVLNAEPAYIHLGGEGLTRYPMLHRGSHRIDAYAGPWLVGDGWWKNDPPSAYLHVVCPGIPPLLLMRQQGWTLIGIYD
ncbi:hypothetical protein [Actinomyces vulturis]|uniref:Y-family DNA polymerase n=1 Tax=Actinomyces vulturis TaxID=1857645 RepID=UPI000833FF36|nr:hypothetical protein [Actinomyces vulturis]